MVLTIVTLGCSAVQEPAAVIMAVSPDFLSVNTSHAHIIAVGPHTPARHSSLTAH